MKFFSLAALLIGTSAFAIAAAPAPETASPPSPQAPSSAAQKLYASARDDLLQIRVLLKNGRTQSSVGSGFLVGQSDLVVTNYHVVSQIALEPDTYVGEYVDTKNQRGSVELLAVDVLHDLAVVRVGRKGTGVFNLPEKLPELVQGQYLYSLGNPLDLGFAIAEGTYNGVMNRGFSEQLMFTGAINAGMSGGPNVMADGRVAGVNVAKRLDGELVSFLVPARYVQEILKTVAAQKAPPKNFKAVIGQQLLTYQTVMMDRLLATPFTLKMLGPYQVPARESDQVRCWGSSDSKPENPFTLDQINCSMESAVFVSEQIRMGHVSIRHELSRSNELGALRFSRLASKSFKNETFGNARDARLTAPACAEQFINNKKLPLRAVLCVSAYRKFPGLYDFSLLTASVDDSLASLQSRLDARGVSYENGLRISRIFLESIGKGGKS